MDVEHESSLVLNAAFVGEPPAHVPEGDAGKVGRHLPPRRVARHAGVAPVWAARPVSRGQRRARRVGARAVAPAAGTGRVPRSVRQWYASARVLPHPLRRCLNVKDDLGGCVGEEGGFEEGHHNLVHAGEVPHALHNLSGAIFSCLLKKSIRAKVMASKLAQ